MLLNYLELKNWCQYTYRLVEFNKGLTAILGPNGSGKSNLVNAIYYALTGDSRNLGVNADNVNQLAKSTDSAYVELGFSHAGVDAVIRRSLQPLPTRVSMQTGGQTYRKSGEIEEVVENVLGINKKIMSDYIFVRQKKLDGLLHLSFGERNYAYQRLFGAWKADKCWSVITEYLRDLNIPKLDIDVSAVSNRLKDNQLLHADIIETLVSYNDVPDSWNPLLDPDYVFLGKFGKIGELEEEIEKWKGELLKADDSLNGQVRQYAVLAGSIQSTELQISNYDIESINVSLVFWKSQKSIETIRANCAETLCLINKSIDSLIRPVQPDDLIPVEQWSAFCKEKEQADDEYRTVLKFLDTFDNFNRAECPTCGTAAEDLKDKVESYRKRSIELYGLVKRLQNAYDVSNNYRKAMYVFDTTIANLEKQRQNTETQLKSLEVPKDELPVHSHEDAKVAFNSYNELVDKLSKLNVLKSELDTRTSTLTKWKALSQENLSKCEKALAELLVHKDEVDKISARFSGRSERFKEKIRLQSDLQSVNRFIDDDSRSLLATESLCKRIATLTSWSSTLESVRSTFHKDALPGLLSQKYLELLESDINKMLDELGSTFKIKAVEGLNFQAIFPDGRDQTAARLSEGEKAILSLALRIVVNSTFAGDIGLICLDEPTDGLDRANLKCLETALVKLRELSTSIGIQCLLVTHEMQLAPLFDHVIEL